ncbi:MAG: histidine phosphatase family protein [Oscillospiraceae bacterium]|nr:histidine phosphatase family protein [Oscillospiraceae bacterium]
MKTFKLHLIRHGLTEGNLNGIYMGSGLDLPLCERGKQEIIALRAKFDYPQVNTVFCSPLLRATQTADILYPDAKKLVIEDLKETNFGEFEGQPAAQLVHNENFKKWLDPKSNFTPQGGESGADFGKRTGAALMRMFEFMIKSGLHEAACITHGGVIMSMLSQHALPPRSAEQWLCDNGCGYTLLCTPSMWMRDDLAEAIAIVPEGYVRLTKVQNDDDEVVKKLASEPVPDFEHDPDRLKF